MDVSVDVLIIGAGPVGIFGAYYAGFRGLRVAVMDSLREPGGQVTTMYPEKQLLDIAGMPSIRGRDLVRGLLDQAAPFDPNYILGHTATTLDTKRVSDRGIDYVVTSAEGATVRTRCIAITSGVGRFTPRRLPCGERFLGRGFDYFVTDLDDYRGRDIVIVGGGDSAFDWAIALQPYATSVTLVHRRDRFRAHAHLVETARDLGVEIVTNAEVTDTRGADGLEAVTIRGSDGEHPQRCQRLIAALGFTANLGPLLDWGIDIRNRRHVTVDSSMQTDRQGIFAAGDIAEYAGKVRLIAVGFGEIATAVNNAAVYIDPSQSLFPGHSTDTAEPNLQPSPSATL